MSFVQDKAASSVATSISSLPVSLTGTGASSRLTVHVLCIYNSTITISDSLGNSWAQVGSTLHDASNEAHSAQFTCNNSVGGNVTITVAFGTTQTYVWIYVCEHSGRTATNANVRNLLPTVQSFPGTGTDALASGALTGVADGSDLLVIGQDDYTYNIDTFTAGTGWTARSKIDTTNVDSLAETQDAVSAGSYTGTFTLASSYGQYAVWITEIPVGGSPTMTQTKYRFRNDDGTLT